MRLGLDGRILAYPYSGIGSYLLNLIQGFKELEVGEVYVYSDRPFLEEYQEQLKGVRSLVFGEKHRKEWGRWLVSGQLKKDKIDLYHAIWNRGIPLYAPCPTVVTIYDIFPLIFPDLLTSHRQVWKYGYHLFLDCLRADQIITISECTRQDILHRFPLFRKKITVTLLGVHLTESQRISAEYTQKWKKHFGLEGPYLISVLGRLAEKRKNSSNLIHAFKSFQKDYPQVTLLMIGSGTTDGIEDEKAIRVLENVPREALLSLIKGAEFMVHPTLYEGFGLPILEAMASGTPVIAGEGGAVCELFGESVLLVDPREKQSLSAGMRRMMSDSALRSQYKNLGEKRAEQFTWEKTVKETLQLYQQTL